MVQNACKKNFVQKNKICIWYCDKNRILFLYKNLLEVIWQEC